MYFSICATMGDRAKASEDTTASSSARSAWRSQSVGISPTHSPCWQYIIVARREDLAIQSPLTASPGRRTRSVSYTHLRAHETGRISYAVFCLKKKKKRRIKMIKKRKDNTQKVEDDVEQKL